ncbi:MAG: PD-(D/E)XK nuclease domain-containing protein [Proteobacteria bacterium]|nr:PD-(D/E)XK nuclease domain-containing protein [Pseudomonadota bacterium]
MTTKDTVLAKGMEQIKARSYAEEYKSRSRQIHLLGLAFNAENKVLWT